MSDRYGIWIVEYSYIPDQPIGSILLGRHNAGTRMFPMTYAYLNSPSHNVLVDVGVGDTKPNSLALRRRDNISGWKSPKALLSKLGTTPEKIDAIFITHAHFDHMDNLEAFPNATVYLQRREYEGCVNALKLPARYQSINKALNAEDFDTLREMMRQGRVRLLDGDVKDVLPGIDVRVEFDGHSYASQIVSVAGRDGNNYVFSGDLVYSAENFTAGADGSFVPVGLSVGDQMSLMRAMDHLLELVDGDISRILIAHEPNNWVNFDTKTDSEGLHIAQVTK